MRPKQQPQFRVSDEQMARQIAEQEAADAEREQARRDDLAMKLWHGSGVPKRHAERTEFVGAAWLEKHALVQSRLGTGMIIALIGRRGPGKTQMAVEAVRATCRNARKGRYVKALDVFLAIRATYNSANRSEREVITDFLEPTLLVIDEIHVRGEKPWEDMMLTHIIDKRYDAMRDTIVVSNQHEAGLVASLGASITDRMRECGGIIECAWPSFRQKAERAA